MHTQKIVVLLQAERAFLHFELKPSERKILTLLEKLRLAHRIETNLVEEAQQPRLAATDSTSAACGRRTGIHPVLPYRTHRDTRRRCRLRFPASRCALDCIWW